MLKQAIRALCHLILFCLPVTTAAAVSLIGPRSVPSNAAFEVQLQGEIEQRDQIHIIDADGKRLQRVYVANLKQSNVATMTAPFEPADYLVIYIADGERTASHPFTVTPVSATIEPPPPQDMNASFDVTFSGPNNTGDTIEIRDNAGKSVSGRGYVGNSKDGVMSLRAPAAPGGYSIVYITAHNVIGEAPLEVRGVTATVDAPESVAVSSRVSVTYEGPDNEGDYIQFVDAEGTPVRTKYAYTGLAKDGVLNVSAPDEAGSYTLDYFTGRTSIGSTAVSVTAVDATLKAPATVTGGALFTVEVQGPNHPGDRVDIVTPAGEFLKRWAYPSASADTLTLRAPETAGSYSIIYRTGGNVVGETAFTVAEVTASLEADDSVPALVRFHVSWAGPGNYGDSIHLIDPESGTTLSRAYIEQSEEGPSASGAIFMLAPEAQGSYQLAYITHGRNTLARKAIDVTPAEVKPGWLRVLQTKSIKLQPTDAVEVILDASGSMLQRQDGERRIVIAKRTLTHLVTEVIPEQTPFALRVFGHMEADSCRTDLELPLAPLDREAVNAKIARINAMNLAKTPIAQSLRLTASDLSAATGERIIILVTDGEETCDGDPAEVINTLRSSTSNVRVNIVGYAIDDEELRSTFERWASLGGGAYFGVGNESELSAALTRSVNPTFAVLDEDAVEVASGAAGGESVSLNPGTYTLRTALHEVAVIIESEEVTELELP